MNDAHLHLFLNHFPFIGLVIGTLILLAGILSKSPASRKAGLLVILCAAILSIPAFNSGEGAEEIVEHLPGKTDQDHYLIHEHEEAAETFIVFAWSLIALSAIAFFIEWKNKRITRYVTLLTLLLALAGIYFAANTAKTGGEISHPEIRKEFKAGRYEGAKRD